MAESPDPAEVKKQLEAIAGRTIEISPEQIKLFSFPVGAHDVTDGTVEWENIFGFKSCIASSLLDASGAVTTGTAGNVTFLLSNVICLPQVRSLAEPVHLVATAQNPTNPTPFYVTTTHAIVAGGTDVQVTVFAWDAKGNPAPSVLVHWRCRVVSNPIIL